MNIKRRFVLYLTLIIAVLQGCSSRMNIKDDYILTSSTKGIVFGSVTQTGGYTAWVDIRKKGTEEKIRITSEGFRLTYEIQDDPNYGSLYALDLESGIYEIIKWTLYEFINAGIIFYNYYMPVDVEPIEFEVGPNEVIYLANFHVVATIGKALLFVPVVVTAEGQIHDRYERDVKIFHKKYPQLRHLTIRKVVPNPNLWKGLRVERTTM